LALAAAVTAVGVGTAAGADPAPVPCTALAYKDVKGDPANLAAVPEVDNAAVDAINAFVRHDPAKGADATTYNLVVDNLTLAIPGGYTTRTWSLYYDVDGTTRFVRAIADFTGAVVYEYGNFTPLDDPSPLAGLTLYEGNTKGTMFEGPNGVVSIVVPPEVGGGAGKAWTAMYASTGQGKTLPTAFPPQGTRGLFQVMDTAPDDGAAAGGKYTVSPCVANAAAPTGGGTNLGTGSGAGTGTGTGTGPIPGGEDPGSSGSTGEPNGVSGEGPAPLPVKVSGSVKRPKGKSLSIKLTSTEELTSLGARLRKGSKTVGSGKLAKLARKGTLKIKLSKKLKKGSYVLDLVGNRASGQRGAAALKVKVK
jgi:hypothetical protein